MSDITVIAGPGGFLGMLALLFIGLKLTGYIDWSWFWVLSPLLFPIIIFLFIITITIIMFNN